MGRVGHAADFPIVGRVTVSARDLDWLAVPFAGLLQRLGRRLHIWPQVFRWIGVELELLVGATAVKELRGSKMFDAPLGQQALKFVLAHLMEPKTAEPRRAIRQRCAEVR